MSITSNDEVDIFNMKVCRKFHSCIMNDIGAVAGYANASQKEKNRNYYIYL